MVGSLNTRITIKSYTNAVDAGGGSSKVLDEEYTTWANAENRTGQADYANGQRQAGYDYRFKIRAHTSRTVTTANVVELKGNEMIINSVQNVDEGKISFLILKCSLHGGT